MNKDHALLQRYVRKGDESAFAQVVESHSGLVYGTALRRVNGDSSLAQDITQQVFIDLARKAGSLPAKVIIPGWLHQHACFLASNALRSRSRRLNREMKAVSMNPADSHPESTGSELGAELDAALEDLAAGDRDILILRFLNQQDLRTVGAAFGLSEDAAQKRVSRALDRLRDIFARRGHVMTSAALIPILAGAAVMVTPTAFANTITNTALAYGASVSGVSHAWEVLFMNKTKLTLAVLLAVGILVPVTMQQRIRALEEERVHLQAPARPKSVLNSPVLQTIRPTSDFPARLRSRSAMAATSVSRSSNEASLSDGQSSSAPQISPETSGTNTGSVSNQWFTIEGSIPVSPGETVITGGWELKPGKRYFALITPTTQADGTILIDSRLIGVGTEGARTAGLEGLITDQESAENYGLTDREETKGIIAHLKNQSGFEMLSSPKIVTGAGMEAEITVGEEIRLRFTPRVAANGTDIALDVRGALKPASLD